jgi:hypothetical protein
MSKYSYHTIGSKYEETAELDIKEVAKLIRADLKKAYPAYKFSVRIERYANGQAIDLVAKNTGINRRSTVGADEHMLLVRAFKGITNQYNFDDSDSMSDYHHVRFYCHPRIEN